MAEVLYKIADQQEEFEAIHRLNYQTFVDEIPQHPANAAGLLVDRFHDENVYAIGLDGRELAGMVAGRCTRPFSLDSKLANLDSYLPAHARIVEIRLLAVRPAYRNSRVFARLIVQLARHFRALGCDLAVISGTIRQLDLYEHMGFRSFGPRVGSADAPYQPMYLTLDSWRRNVAISTPAEPALRLARFTPGPVPVSAAVSAALAAPPISHRSPEFVALMAQMRRNLCDLTGAAHALVLAGTGTLANDAVAAQLNYRGQPGLVLANGEFGDRLIAHARSWRVPHQAVQLAWGEPFDWQALQRITGRTRPAWIWAVLCETSTGMTNDPACLRDLCAQSGAELCLDAVSAVGLMPVDLRGVWLASTVSGKALSAYPGLAVVLHEGRLAPAGVLPRYLDLGAYENAGGVPYTHSSNLLAAFERALASTQWSERYVRTAAIDGRLRAALRAHGLEPLVADASATPGIITLAIPHDQDSQRLALRLAADGIGLAYESAYLRQRNWIQICLMGEFDPVSATRIPELLAAHLRPVRRSPQRRGALARCGP